MSEENINKADNSVCASCGVAEVDNNKKLKECADCDLVRYCSDACQKEHTSQRQQECKKRAAELRDEILFKQPESTHLGDCPICMIPMPLDRQKSSFMTCCSKIICKGCAYANGSREREEKLGHSCPFCRKPVSSPKQGDKQTMKRVAANDPVAMRRKGTQQYKKEDYRSAFEYYTRAAELGDADAKYNLACMYEFGKGADKDRVKAIHCLEEAAIGGHHIARHRLGLIEWNNGNTERAMKHLIIAAKLGENDSIKVLMDAFRDGLVSKDDLASALRAHQAAVDATKSPQREVADEHDRRKGLRIT
eukprot:scaffold1769_cov132-Skeletonema_dohrnii-CCMP3373.AAC.4